MNNAGAGYLAAVEETPGPVLEDMFNLHLFGPAALIRAVLPGARRRGTIVQLSSVGGQVAFTGLGAYCATKFAIEGCSEALAGEVAPLGIRVLIDEPGGFRTEFCGDKMFPGTPTPDYQDTAGLTQSMMRTSDGVPAGDPVRAAKAILRALAAPSPPLRLLLGDDAVDLTLAKLTAMIKEIREWETLSPSTSFADIVSRV